MKNLIPITNLPNLYGVKIDNDATEIQLTHHAVAYKSVTSNLPTDTNGFRFIEVGLGALREFEPLGTIDSKEISFDASEMVLYDDFPDYQYGGEVHPKQLFWNYQDKRFEFESCDDSFRSALEVEIFFVNPFGENEPELNLVCCGNGIEGRYGNEECCFRPRPDEQSQHLQDLWQTAEANKTEKLLIIRKL